MAIRPLVGTRVVDLTTSIAGPLCAEVLAALGAAATFASNAEPTAARGVPFRIGDAVFESQQAFIASGAPNVRAI